MKKASNVKTIVESQAASASAAASSPMSKSSALRALAAALAALVLAWCVGFMSGCSSNSYTPEPSEQKIDNSLLHTPGTLRVGVDASNAPYAAQSQGSIVGIDVDTAAALADELGLKLELVDVGTNAEGETYKAKLVGTDPSSDLAVIKVDGATLKPIEIGNSSDLKVGEWVMAAGSPFGMEQSVSTGIVSAVNRSYADSESGAIYTNMIQTDAAINSGNSGGALVDAEGKLIGINTLIMSTSGTSSGVGFAIPVDYAFGIAEQLIQGKTPSHAQLGVSLITVNNELAQRFGIQATEGAYINSLTAGGAAAKAGLQEGDVILKVDGESITSSSDLVLAIRSHSPNDEVDVTYLRDGKEETTKVKLGADTQ